MAARHGSRFPNNSRNHINLKNTLEAYNKQKMLSLTGQALLFELKRYLFRHQHSFTSINQRGVSEHALLAKRLVDTHPTFFLQKRNFTTYCTYKKRTQQSMYAFIDGLHKQQISFNIEKHIFKRGQDPVLRFLDMYLPYQAYIKKPPWRSQGISIINENTYQQMIKRIVEQLFNPPLNRQMLDNHSFNRMDEAEFIYQLYHYLIYLDDSHLPENTVITSIFTSEDMRIIYQLDNLKSFYKYGPGYPDNPLSSKAATAFFIFLNHCFHQIKTDNLPVNGIFIFAHKETLLPIITFLNINHVNTPQYIFDQKKWSSRAIIPMAGNVSWLILSKKKAWYVQIRLNEKPAVIPALGKAKDNIYPLDQFIRYTEKRIADSALNFGEPAKLYRLAIPDLINTLANRLTGKPM